MNYNNARIPMQGNFLSSVNHEEKGSADYSPDDQCTVGGIHAFVLRIKYEASGFWVSSVFGMAPLRFRPHGIGYTVSLSNYMCIYSYLLITVIAAIAFFRKGSEFMLGSTPSEHMRGYVVQVVGTYHVIVVTIMASIGVYGAPSRMRSMLKCMDTIASVDKSIGALYSHTRERRLFAALILFLVFSMMLIIFDAYLHLRNDEDVASIWNMAIHHLLSSLVFIMEVQFAITAFLVQTRFKALNKALSLTARCLSVPNVQKFKNPETLNIFAIKVAPTLQSEKVTVLFRKSLTGEPYLVVSPSDAVHRIAPLHSALCGVVHRIDDSYSSPLIIILLSTLINLIIYPYFAISGINPREPKNYLNYVILVSLWIIFHILRLLMVVEPCHYTIDEGRKTESLVSRMMLVAPTSGPLCTRLELFSRQLMMQSLSYNPKGLCTLDRQLIASMFGAVVTYLVILIQFREN